MTFFRIKKKYIYIYIFFLCVFVTVLCVFAPLPEYIRGPEKGERQRVTYNSDWPEYPPRLINLQ